MRALLRPRVRSKVTLTKRRVLKAVGVVGFVAVFAACLPTRDIYWGWVSEGGQPHRVCGEAEQHKIEPIASVAGRSQTWFQGWGTSDPGCETILNGDWVPAYWLQSKANVWIHRDGQWHPCEFTSWEFKDYTSYYVNATANCYNSIWGRSFTTQAFHRWWASDVRDYAAFDHWTPVGEV